MGKLRFGTSVLAVLLVAACIADAGEKQITVKGKVVDMAGKPVAGAAVSLYCFQIPDGRRMQAGLLCQEKSDADGKFTFSHPSAKLESKQHSIWVVFAKAEGHAFGWTNYGYGKNPIVSITLGKPAELSGTVVDEVGKPLAGVEVSAVLMNKSEDFAMGLGPLKDLVTKTDSQGVFAFKNVPEDCAAEFSLSAPGRAFTTTFNASSGPPTWQYSPGQKGIRITFTKEAIVEGMVVDKSTGEPLQGITVLISGRMPSAAIEAQTVFTDAQGRFRVGKLPEGRLDLVVGQLPGEDSIYLPHQMKVNTKAGQVAKIGKIPLAEASFMEVLLIDSTGAKPLADAAVNFINTQTMEHIQAKANQEGVVRLKAAPGQYRPEWLHLNGRSLHRNQADWPVVTVEEGKNSWHMVALDNITWVHGTVLDPAGGPVVGTVVRVLPAGTKTVTDAEGRFGLFAYKGEWEDDHSNYILVRDEKRNLCGLSELDETSQARQIRLTAGAILKGRVVDEKGSPIVGASVRGTITVGRFGCGFTDNSISVDEDGVYEISAIPGGHKLAIKANAHGFGTQSVKAELDEGESQTVVLKDAVLAKADQTLSGVVVDEDGKPVVNAGVRVWGKGQPDNLEGRTDREGKFTIKGLAKGKVGVYAYVHGPGRKQGQISPSIPSQPVKITMGQQADHSRRLERIEPVSLVGKPLTKLEELGGKVDTGKLIGKQVLVCFWSYQQRPSRYMIRQLIAQQESLAAKGVEVVLVHDGSCDEAMQQWCKKNKTGLPIAELPTSKPQRRNRILASFGVKGLPWLILTDKQHKVTAEGFDVSQLAERIAQTTGKAGQTPQ